jgi:site-specific DNA recombinase
METNFKPIRKMGIYLRKSRAEDGIKDLEKHKEYLINLCVNKFNCDYELFEEIDSSITLERTELQRLRQWVTDGLIDGVMVNAVDRLSRKTKHFCIIVEDYFLHEDEKKMPRLFVKDQEYDLTNHQTYMMLTFTATLSQAEYHFIAQRLKDGLKASAKKGVRHGRKLFGYRYNKDKKKMVQVADEIEVVREIIDLLLIGDTYGGICDKLNLAGKRTREGKLFDIHNIKSIVHSPTVRGHLIIHWKDGSITEEKDVHKDVAVMNDAEYYKIQEILNNRADNYKSLSTAPKHYLQGILRCPRCNKVMSIACAKKTKQINKERIYLEGTESYYVRACRNQRSNEKCGNTGCNVELVENYLRNYIKEFEPQIDERISYFLKIDGEEIEKSHKEKINNYNKALDKLDEREENLDSFLEDGTIDKEKYNKRIEKLNEERAELKNKLSKAENNYSSIDIEANLNQLTSIKNSIKKWDNLENEQKRQLIQMIFSKIEYKKFEGSKKFELVSFTNLK